MDRFLPRRSRRLCQAVAVAVLLLSQGTGAARAAELVDTADRLNLRTCPATRGCAVVRTLPRSTRLEVLNARAGWLQVRVQADGREGWVHSGYVVSVAPPAPPPARSRLPAKTWRILLAVAGAVLLLSFLIDKTLPPQRDVRPLSLVLGSLAIGSFFLLNQFGPLLARFLAPLIDLAVLSPLWRVNAAVDSIGYPIVVGMLALFSLGIAALAPRANGGQDSFLQGLLTGTLLLPATTLTAALIVLVSWLLMKIVLFLLYVLSLIWIPFRWIFEHLLQPLLELIAIPFVWLWEHALLPLLRLIAIPFVWVWEHVLKGLLALIAKPFVWLWTTLLQPLVALLAKWIVRPLFLLTLSIIAVTLCLLPVAAVGLTVIEATRASFKDAFNPRGLFSQGMATGFLLFDSLLLIALDRFDVLRSAPPLTVLLMLGLPLVTMLRLLVKRGSDDRVGGDEELFEKFRSYCRSSKVELLTTCLIAPLFLILQVTSGEE